MWSNRSLSVFFNEFEFVFGNAIVSLCGSNRLQNNNIGSFRLKIGWRSSDPSHVEHEFILFIVTELFVNNSNATERRSIEQFRLFDYY